MAENSIPIDWKAIFPDGSLDIQKGKPAENPDDQEFLNIFMQLQNEPATAGLSVGDSQAEQLVTNSAEAPIIPQLLPGQQDTVERAGREPVLQTLPADGQDIAALPPGGHADHGRLTRHRNVTEYINSMADPAADGEAAVENFMPGLGLPPPAPPLQPWTRDMAPALTHADRPPLPVSDNPPLAEPAIQPLGLDGDTDGPVQVATHEARILEAAERGALLETSGRQDGDQPLKPEMLKADSPTKDTAVKPEAKTGDRLFDLKQSLQEPAWKNEFARHMVRMSKDGIQSARLRLNPPRLGLIEVKVSVMQDQASISFQSPHAQVREAIEGAMVRLRNMLQEQGLNLAHADVSTGQQQRQDQRSASVYRQTGDGFIATELPIESVSRGTVGISLIDMFA